MHADEECGFDSLGAVPTPRPRIVVPKISPAAAIAAAASGTAPTDPAASVDEAKGGKGKGAKADSDKESWFTRPVVGKLPGAGVLVIGGGLLGGIGYLIKRIFFKGAVR